MADVRRRSAPVPAPPPVPAPLPPPPDLDPEPTFDEPTRPAFRAIAARGTEQRARRARRERASRDTQPLPLPRPPAGQKR